MRRIVVTHTERKCDEAMQAQFLPTYCGIPVEAGMTPGWKGMKPEVRLRNYGAASCRRGRDSRLCR